jgi:Na+/H+-dicarboxylate symporter/ABC-type amino acid transport substrate-binding protein
MSFTKQILLGLVSGVIVGVFLGELVVPVKVVADGFVKLLQMTVLPYVTISIISSLGSLDHDSARKLGLRAGAVLVLLWAIALLFAFLVPLALPEIENASFFSTTLLEQQSGFNFVDLYIPANPFHSLANNVVPAVVLFSVILGVALIGVERKTRLLEVLSVTMDTVSRATHFVVRLTPLGIFAIAANAAGTLKLAEIERIEMYLIAYVVISLLVALWVLPGLVSALMPVSWREVFSSTRDALITAFMVGQLFIVLPSLIEACQRILKRCHADDEGASKLPEVIVPASFNFPHTGKLLSLSFILFAGWFSDAAISLGDYPRLALTGLLTFFGSLNAAVPFLLDMFQIPADTFQLFLATGVINARFGTLLATVHTVVIALLGSAAISGLIRFEPVRLIRYVGITAVLTVVTIGGLKILNSSVLSSQYHGDELLYGMQPLFPEEESIAASGESSEKLPLHASSGVLGKIYSRGVLRIGHFMDRMPYAFLNREKQLVGFDVEMGRMLANSLGVSPEFHLLDIHDAAAALANGEVDIIMTGAVATPARAAEALLSESYVDETFGFVVLDHHRREFSTWDAIRALGPIRIGVPAIPYYVNIISQRLPDAIIETIDLGGDYVPHLWDFEAIAAPAERGSVLTLLNPQYSVVIPKPGTIRVPLIYPIARNDRTWADLVNTFINLKQKDGTIEALYDHWILGRDAAGNEPRWSIIRNVLHWVE